MAKQLTASGRPAGLGDPPSRLTVVETVYHWQSGDCDQRCWHSAFSRDLETAEEMWQRASPQKVGDQWQEVETGWVGLPGMLVVANREQREGVLLLGVIHESAGLLPFAVVRPGESARFEPFGRVMVRSADSKGCLYAVAAVPR